MQFWKPPQMQMGSLYSQGGGEEVVVVASGIFWSSTVYLCALSATSWIPNDPIITYWFVWEIPNKLGTPFLSLPYMYRGVESGVAIENWCGISFVRSLHIYISGAARSAIFAFFYIPQKLVHYIYLHLIQWKNSSYTTGYIIIIFYTMSALIRHPRVASACIDQLKLHSYIEDEQSFTSFLSFSV